MTGDPNYRDLPSVGDVLGCQRVCRYTKHKLLNRMRYLGGPGLGSFHLIANYFPLLHSQSFERIYSFSLHALPILKSHFKHGQIIFMVYPTPAKTYVSAVWATLLNIIFLGHCNIDFCINGTLLDRKITNTK